MNEPGLSSVGSGSEVPFSEDSDQALRRAAYLKERLAVFGAGLDREFRTRVNLRQHVERAWLEDLRAYNGRYDDAVLAEIRKNEGSELFVNYTRPKTDAIESRLADAVLRTQDENWEISPTAVPEIADLAANMTVIGQAATDDGRTVDVTASDLAISLREVAESRCALMRSEMRDQMQECQFNATLRQVIHDACVLGTGVLKGPSVVSRFRREWSETVTSDGTKVQTHRSIKDRRPVAVRVDPWDFYPESGITGIAQSEIVFERHWTTRSDLRRLVREQGFDAETAKQILVENRTPPAVVADHRIQLQALSGSTIQIQPAFELIEANGSFERDDLLACGCDLEGDELDEYRGTVWFLQGKVLKAELEMMEGLQEQTYKVFNLHQDDSSIFGRGNPRQMRTSQILINSLMRMMVDSGGLAVGGQLVYVPGVVVPADGNPRMTPRKSWWFMADGTPFTSVDQVFRFVQVPHQVEWLIPLFNLAIRLADEESNLPLIAQGDQHAAITKTHGGMALLAEAANVMLLRSVSAIDDNVIVPFVTDLYNWNMLYNPKAEIKGDYRCFAKGAAAVAERTQQLQSFLQFINFFGQDPILRQLLNIEGVAEEAARLLRVNRPSLMKSTEQVKEIIAKAENAPAVQPKAPAVEVAEINAASRERVEEQRLLLQKMLADESNAIRLEQIAATVGMDREKLLSTLGLKRQEIDSTNQRFNAEIATRIQTGAGI